MKCEIQQIAEIKDIKNIWNLLCKEKIGVEGNVSPADQDICNKYLLTSFREKTNIFCYNIFLEGVNNDSKKIRMFFLSTGLKKDGSKEDIYARFTTDKEISLDSHIESHYKIEGKKHFNVYFEEFVTMNDYWGRGINNLVNFEGGGDSFYYEQIGDEYRKKDATVDTTAKIEKMTNLAFSIAKENGWLTNKITDKLCFFPLEGNPMESDYFLFTERKGNYRAGTGGKFWYGLKLIKKFELMEKLALTLEDTDLKKGFLFENDINKFYGELAEKAIPEDWSNNSELTKIKDKMLENGYRYHNILRNYIENTYKFMSQNDDVEHYFYHNSMSNVCYFNTGLIDRKSYDDIIIRADLREQNVEIYSGIFWKFTFLKNLSSHAVYEKEVDNVPTLKLAKYYSNAEDLVFKAEYEIKITDKHIFDEHIERFKIFKESNCEEENVIREIRAKFDNAKKKSQQIAKRNLRFVVPYYSFESKKICFLMPIFFDEDWVTLKPQCVLVLNEIRPRVYKAISILNVEDAYKDARLLGPIESSWLKNYAGEEI